MLQCLLTARFCSTHFLFLLLKATAYKQVASTCLDGGVIRAGGKLEVRGAEGNSSHSLLVRGLCLQQTDFAGRFSRHFGQDRLAACSSPLSNICVYIYIVYMYIYMYIHTNVGSHGCVSFCVFVCVHVPRMHKAGARVAFS